MLNEMITCDNEEDEVNHVNNQLKTLKVNEHGHDELVSGVGALYPRMAA